MSCFLSLSFLITLTANLHERGTDSQRVRTAVETCAEIRKGVPRSRRKSPRTPKHAPSIPCSAHKTQPLPRLSLSRILSPERTFWRKPAGLLSKISRVCARAESRACPCCRDSPRGAPSKTSRCLRRVLPRPRHTRLFRECVCTTTRPRDARLSLERECKACSLEPVRWPIKDDGTGF